MKIVPMLHNVDDEKHFAQLLEVAYCEAATELNVICHTLMHMVHEESFGPAQGIEVLEAYEQLNRLQFVMIATVQQTIERRRRLADVATGLADVIFDEKGTKE